MEFKNDQFEREASKTLSTLEALKQKLNNNFSTKGAEELNQAIKTVDVSPITKGLEAVQVQFSALQIAGKRVIENIVDAAMNAIGNVKNKLMGVVNQIKVGGANRAQNIENAKFMLSGLGIEWADIVDDINYGVQDTAYGLDAAAKVASQLVASNVTLGKEMQSSLRAVSGVAAMTNSTYEEIGHIFTSIAGQGKLMTMQLQQFSLRGLNVAADLAKAMNTTEAEIRDMVTKGKIDFQTFANAMDELYGEHAKEANKTFSGALSNTKAALSRLGADIQAQKFETLRTILLEVTAKLKELKKALAPVEESINTMIEAVGKLVESFIKSVDIKGIVDKIAPKIESFCSLVTRVADAWREIREEEKKLNAIVYDNGYTAYYTARAEAFGQSTDEIVEAVDKLAALSDDQLAKFKQNAWDIWTEGKYGNGQERVDALKDDYELTQEYVEKMIELGWDQEKMDEYIAAQRKKRDEQVQAKKRVDSIKTTVKNVLAIFDNLKIVMHNIFSSIVNVVSAAFGGLSESFTNVGLLGAVVNMTAKLAEFSNKIAITKEKADKIRPVAKAIGDIIKTIAKGLYNCIKFLVNFISAAAKNEVVIAIFTAIKKAITAIFDGLKTLYTKLKESGAWDKFVDILKLVAGWIGDKIVAAFDKMTDLAPKVADKTVSAFEKIINKIKDLIDGTGEGNTLLEKMAGILQNGVDISKTWLGKLGDGLKKIFGESEDEESVFKIAYNKAAAFGRGLIEGINSITWDDIKEAGGLALKLYSVISLLNLIGSWTAINRNVGKFFKGLTNFFNSLTGMAKASSLRVVASAMEALGRTLALIVGSIVALTLVIAYAPGGEAAVERAISIVRQFVSILALTEIILAIAQRVKPVKNAKKLTIAIEARKLAMAMILTSLATLIWTVFKYIQFMNKGITGKDPQKFAAATILTLVVFSTILFELVVAIKMLMSSAEAFKGSLVGPEFMNAVAKVLNSLTKAIVKVMLAIALMTVVIDRTDPESFLLAFLSFVGVITALSYALYKINNLPLSTAEGDSSPLALKINMLGKLAKMFALLMAEIAIISIVYSKVSIGNILLAVGTFVVVIAALVTALWAINKINVTDPNALFLKMSVISSLVKTFSLILLAFAGLALAIGAMNKMGVDATEFMTIVGVISACIGLLTFLGGMIASVPTIAAGLTAFGAALTGLGVAFAGIGGGVLMLVVAMYMLDKFIDKVDDFYKKLIKKKDLIVDTITTLVSIAAEGIVGGLLEALQRIIKNMGKIVDALIDTLIVIFKTLGEALSNRAGELADATRVLVRGIVKVIVEVLVEAIGGILEGLTDAIDDINKRFDEWLNKEEQKDIEKQQGDYKDNLASTYVAYIKSDKASKTEAEKEAMRQWLAQNGYDENGKRTEDWTLETTVQYEDILNFESKSKSQEYAERNTGSRGYVAFNGGDVTSSTKEAKEEAKQAEEDSNDILSSMENYASNALESKEVSFDIKEYMGDAATNITDANIGLGSAMNSLGNDLYNEDSIANSMEVIGDAAEEGATNFEEYQSAVTNKTEILASAIENMANRIRNALSTLGDDSLQYGRDVVDGFVNGMSAVASLVKIETASKNVCTVVTDTFEKIFDINSPSKVMMGYGEFVMLGLIKGMSEKVQAAASETEDAGRAVIYSMRNTLKNLSTEVFSDMEPPRITPVLDLSNLDDGLTSMDRMLGIQSTYGLAMTTNAEAISSRRARVNQWLQNGSNFSDENTVAAINNLNGEVSTLKDAINGMQVVIDGRALVGQIATPMDKALGKKAMAGRRGR